MQLANDITDLNYKVSTISFNDYEGNNYEVMVFCKKIQDEVEQKRFATEKEAMDFHKKMVKKYSATEEVKELFEACTQAQQEANKYKNTDEGGACNFDSVVLDYRRRKKFVDKFNRYGVFELERINYGIYKGFYDLNLTLNGQAHRRTKMAEKAREFLNSKGIKASVQYIMD